MTPEQKRYLKSSRLIDALTLHIIDIVSNKKAATNSLYLQTDVANTLTENLERSLDINNIFKMVFDIVDNSFYAGDVTTLDTQKSANAFLDFYKKGQNGVYEEIPNSAKPYAEAVLYVLTYLYPEKSIYTGIYEEGAYGTTPVIDLDTTDLLDSFKHLAIDPQRLRAVTDSVTLSLNNQLVDISKDISSLHLLNQNDELLLTKDQQIGEFLYRAGLVLHPNNTGALLAEYGEKGVLYNNVQTYWPEINAQIKLSQLKTENPSFVNGAGNVIAGIVNPTPQNNQRWINTIVGQSEVFPEADNSNPLDKRTFDILQSGVNYDNYIEFRTQMQDSNAVINIIKQQLGFDKDKISALALEDLAKAFQQTALNMSLDEFYDFNDPSTFPLNDQLFNLIAPSQEIDSLKNQQTNLDIIKNQTGYDAVVSKLLGLDGLNIGDPSTGEKLEITAPDDFKTHISEILKNSLNEKMTVEQAGLKVLETMGISPEGKLVPKPEYYGIPIQSTYTDPITGATFTETNVGEKLERITEAPPITNNELASTENYFHQSQIFQPLDVLLQQRKRIEEEEKRIEEGFTNKDVISQQYGLIPPMHVDADLLGGAPGLPGFRVIPEPVYTDEDVATVLANRYYDKPELLQFLAPQLTSIAEAFRLSQRPSSLTQESFGDFEYYTDTITAGPEGFVQGMKDGKPNVLAPGTKVDIEKSRVVNEYGEAIDDPTSSSAAYSYFERDRPKTIQEYINLEASRLEKGFESSPLFEQQQKRLEQERQAEDARQRQQFVSQPVSIFGRRRR